MPSFTPEYLASLVTVREIHREIGRSREAIYKAIGRLGINPILFHPTRLFDPSVIPLIVSGMRKPSTEATP